MSILFDAMVKRREEYIETTKKIFEFVKERLDRGCQYYFKDGRSIEWFHLEIVSELPSFVNVMGYFKAKVGDTIRYTNGETVVATEENINNLPLNIVNLILPLKILEEGSVTQIHASIRDFDQLQGLLTNAQIVEEMQKLKATDFGELLNNDKLVEKITRPKEFLGFDVSGLTQDQMICLTLTGASANEKMKN